MITKPKSPPKPKPAPKAAKVERKILHPEPKAQLCVGPYALTVERAKELLGWTTDELLAKQHGLTEELFKDLNGNKIWCLNNINNRPLYMDNVATLIQEILNLKWRFNFEPIIITKTGLIGNGQHQLIALCLADQHRLLDGQGKQWMKNWPVPCTIEKLIGYGLEEGDDVIDTMDTAKPRSFADVIYRSNLFPNEKPKDLRTLSKMLDSAVRLLWQRTGAINDAFSPRRTNTEGMEFVRRHPRIIRAVKHIWQEYRAGPLREPKSAQPSDPRKNWDISNRRLVAGYAAALCYLMGASGTDGADYVAMRFPGEVKEKGKGGVNFDEWDNATTFWTLFAQGSQDLGDVFRSLGYLVDPDTGVGGTLAERVTIIVKTWLLWKQKKPILIKSIEPEYSENQAGVRRIGRMPTVGGIDRGVQKAHESSTDQDAEEVPGEGPSDPTIEQIEEKARKIKEEKEAKRKEAAAEAKEKKEKEKVEKNGEEVLTTIPKPPKPRRFENVVDPLSDPSKPQPKGTPIPKPKKPQKPSEAKSE